MANDGIMNHLNIIWESMTRKTNTALIALLGTLLMGLATWVVITLVEIQVIVMMLQQELMDLDKVIGRIYHHMDRLAKWDG
mgnify:CR=1 FL=1